MRQRLVHAQGTSMHAAPRADAVDLAAGWQLLLDLAARARLGTSPRGRTGFAFRDGRWLEVPAALAPGSDGKPQLWLDPALEKPEPGPGFSPELARLLELFQPLVLGARAHELVVGHLGQSLDGRVATPTGASQFITGREDIVHTHRLRALCDAVVVGVRTVQLDDPQLTTRLVSGAHPTRVVLDPQAKLVSDRKLLGDGVADTLIVTSPSALPSRLRARAETHASTRRQGCAEWLAVECTDGHFDLRALLRVLRERGLARIFVEGGGVTVSRFLAAGLLDRLHVTVAPLILGSGAAAFALPAIDRLQEALSLRCRHFTLGPDVLFDCQVVRRAHA